MIHEDDIIYAVASQINASASVLTARASQVRYGYRLSPMTRKAPDLIAVRQDRILVLEAKRRSADLFRPGPSGLGDLDALCCLRTDVEARADLIRQIGPASGRVGYSVTVDTPLVLAVAAGNRFSAAQLARCRDIVALAVLPGPEIVQENCLEISFC